MKDRINFYHKSKHQKNRTDGKSKRSEAIFRFFHGHDDKSEYQQSNACKHDEVVGPGENHVYKRKFKCKAGSGNPASFYLKKIGIS